MCVPSKVSTRNFRKGMPISPAGIDTAVRTSIRAVRMNPGPMAVWGLIVAGGLILGSIPLFLWLIVVMPVLGHATWHLYRKLVAG